MKLISFLFAATLLLPCSIAICKDTVPIDVKPTFRIYLVDEEVNVLDKGLMGKIEKMKLQNEPVLSEKYIKAYNWKTHTIELTKEGVEKFKKMLVYGKPDGEEVRSKDLFQKGMNKVFVIVVNGKRAYMGRTTSVLSSFISPIPSIDVSWLDADRATVVDDADMPENSIRIDKMIKDDEEDVREQEWIKAALEELELLQ